MAVRLDRGQAGHGGYQRDSNVVIASRLLSPPISSKQSIPAHSVGPLPVTDGNVVR